MSNNPTEKQMNAFYNMRRALGWQTDVPKTKEETSQAIGRMKREIEKRIAITGVIRPKQGIHF